MRAEIRIIGFATILAVVCALLLAGAETILKPYREANERAEEVKNYLEALGVPMAADASPEDLVNRFERDVEVQSLGGLDLYAYVPGGAGKPEAYAVPFSGAGLWGPVYGVLALEPDLETIRGVRFYKQEETPGLGGEIGSAWFQQQFVHKRIVSPQGTYGFKIVKPGLSDAANEVDGITGATMTSERVGSMIDNVVKILGKEVGSRVQ